MADTIDKDKIDPGNFIPTNEAFDIISLVRETVDQLESIAKTKNIKLDFDNPLLASLMETIPISTYTQPNFVPDDWSLWSEGSISVSRIGDGGSSENSPREIDSQNIAFGFDKKINESDLLGFAFQYGLSDTDVGSDGTGIDTESLSLTIYRTKPFNNNNFTIIRKNYSFISDLST